MSGQNNSSLLRAVVNRSTPLVFSLFALAAIVVGWQVRDEYWVMPEKGTGYFLGIVGGSMMLLLLLYPLKKHFQGFNLILSTKAWFRLHMMLGVAGPVLILYHCNFSLGSVNSNVALLSMGLMVCSGLVGRYLYSKIHYGLYGKRIFLDELIHKKLAVETRLGSLRHHEGEAQGEFINRLRSFEDHALKDKGLFFSLIDHFKLMLSSRFKYHSLLKLLKVELQKNTEFSLLSAKEKALIFKQMKQSLQEFLAVLREIAGLRFFERLFALWHVFHLPIFFMLIVTGFVHVYAVHFY